MIEHLQVGTIIVLVTVFVVLGLLFVSQQAPVTTSIPFQPAELSEAEQTLLLQLARLELEAVLNGQPRPVVEPDSLPPRLAREGSCFVSLYKDDRLRGCMIDDFRPHESLVRNVLRNVVLAATGDDRFPPVTTNELPDIRIEISVLGALQELSFESSQELLQKLSPGNDGVVLTTSTGQSVYLPWVWEIFPEPEVFLARLCEKQSAPADCWQRKPLPKVELFRVTHFSEADLES